MQRHFTESSPADPQVPLLLGGLLDRVRWVEQRDVDAVCGLAGRVGDVARLRRGAGGPQKGQLWAVGGGLREPGGATVAVRGVKMRVLAGIAGPEPPAPSRGF